MWNPAAMGQNLWKITIDVGQIRLKKPLIFVDVGSPVYGGAQGVPWNTFRRQGGGALPQSGLSL